MTILSIAGIVLTVLLLSVMLGKKNKLYADKFLITYLIFSVVRQIYIYIETEGLLNANGLERSTGRNEARSEESI
ncbi:MAG: hypothetical protein L0Y35_02360 [Flammeovirgaceae bacterium]|nr:hypothetical protein [Flammeovirgaceae bacterium]